MLTKEQAVKFMVYRVLMLEQASTLEDLYELEEWAKNDINYISKQRAMPPIEVGGVRREVTRTVNKRAGELEREAVEAKTFMLAMNALTRPLHNGAYR